jgi:hypothetical protein
MDFEFSPTRHQAQVPEACDTFANGGLAGSLREADAPVSRISS